MYEWDEIFKMVLEKVDFIRKIRQFVPIRDEVSVNKK
jgi:hypothetical protein